MQEQLHLQNVENVVLFVVILFSVMLFCRPLPLPPAIVAFLFCLFGAYKQ